MHRKFVFALIFSFSVILTIQIFAQTKLPGQWSLMFNGNYFTNFGISEAMRGTGEEFYNDLSKDYNNSKFPFGESGTQSFNFGGQLSYRFPESNFSPYLSLNLFFFFLNSDASYLSTSAFASITLFVWSLGCEYTLGLPADLLNIFGRLGINTSTIAGNVHYFTETDVIPTQRLGFETEIGGRLNIPETPLAVELITNYSNINLIGKSYTKPASQPRLYLPERELNDGKNPDNPNDKDRTIDFLSIKLGLKLWF
ncbi:MAG: hypothetical protein A2X61_09835 [Ignavibacteria bacterium GWB2_35_12]|nr:MAG: hypothetical protein A2X63_10390 [Ignavibacteria bacterium GWA2_35_8]OGU39654.1 MAG: hypothetical protein A2X61_09835 [Ignavibacteria bacterium GWB2_35_12]OGU93585.1 MAG: hypothetical protein A2220_03410 [Ignavibacteria bacterium RIFOXYA2_FULL_35_10]OGV23847.1 MAG: hypothetical protein A2475_07030 [Ignavibacteria bacterium RIFOXYC2_FULL_35_21]